MSLPTSFGDIVEEIVRLTALARDEVEATVWAEALEQGSTVAREAERLGVTPHRYDERMADLYRSGNGFVFESLVFWARPSRQAWSADALARIRRLGGDPHVLAYGDGAGSDSLYLASEGLSLDYLDVAGSVTAEFAARRFEHHGVSVRVVEDSEPTYDAIVCFEVLEHLERPLDTLRELAGILRPGGIALITEAFETLDSRHPTHLAGNARYAGLLPLLARRAGLGLTWWSRDQPFKPMELTKLDRPNLRILAQRDVVEQAATSRLRVARRRLSRLGNA